MLYRPLLLLLLLSLLHSSFIAKHLTMNSLPMCIAMMVYIYIFFFLSFFLFRVYTFYSLVHRSDGYLRGKRIRISLTFYLSLFLLADVVMLVIICVHRRSSILSLRSKVVVVVRRLSLAFVLFVFCFFFFPRSRFLSSICSS